MVHRLLNTKLLALVTALLCALGMQAAEAYVYYTPSNTTLTFYYDNLKNSRPGTTYYIDDYGHLGIPAWIEDGTNDHVTQVVFDPSFAGAQPTITMGWFWNMFYLQSITGLNYLNTNMVTDMAEMFAGCNRLTSLDVSNFNTSMVNDMSDMFCDCKLLTSLDVSNFNTSQVTRMEFMFNNCESLTNLDLSSFNTANVTRMDGMFWGCNALTTLDVSNFNTFQVEEMSRMFFACSSLTSLDLSSFNTSNVTEMVNMFSDCEELQTIYAGNGWSTAAVTDSEDMFRNCTSLVGGKGTAYNASHTDATYAHIDGGTSDPGYLTSGREAYIVYTPSNTTMTFYYDKLKSNRPGTTYYIDDYGFIFPAWHEDGTSDNVTRVVFDSSFAGARPYTTTNWFADMTNLSSITGISNLNTSSVLDMSGMFEECRSLTSLDVSGFTTTCTNKMTGMFSGCSSLTSLDVSGFNTENVNDMRFMFSGCSDLTSLNLGNFNTQNASSFQGMFEGCSSLKSLDLSSFDTRNVRAMYDMFYVCSNLTTIYVGHKWVTSQVGSSKDMFKSCTSLVGGQGTTFDASHTDATYAHIDGGPSDPGYLTGPDQLGYAIKSTDGKTLTFYYDKMRSSRSGTSYILNSSETYPGWYSDNSFRTITKVVFDDSFSQARPTTTFAWFARMSNLTSFTGMSNLNTSDVVVMDYMFYGCTGLSGVDLSGFNTNKLTSMEYMFYNCSNLRTLDLSSFNTSRVTDMNYLFRGCSNLTTIYAGSGWTTSSVIAGNWMFTACTSLVGGMGTTYDANHVDKTYAHIDGGPSNPGYFTEPRIPYVLIDDSNGTMTFYNDGRKESHITSSTWLYYLNEGDQDPGWYSDGCYEYVTKVVFDPSFATARPTSTCHWFAEMYNLTSVQGIEYLNTSEVTAMTSMFWECTELPAVDVSGFDTHNVTDMSSMFAECYELNSLDVSGWNTGKVTDMSYLFSSCSEVTSLDVSHFNTSNVTNMYAMFDGCSSLTSLDVSSFDTRNVTNMGWMFNGCSSLTTLNLSGFNTSNVTKMYCMFEYCGGLTSLDVSSFNTSKVTDMSFMFYYCNGLTSLDLSSFNTVKVTDMRDMFYLCEALRTIYVDDGWNTAAVTNSNQMFSYCTSIRGGMGTTYNADHVDKAYAHIDGGPSNPGYFTAAGQAGLRGDVNGDGSVNISDVTALIDYLLSGNADSINLDNADCDQDSNINIADVTALIDHLLSGN